MPVADEVGVLWDVAIGGRGFKLSDQPEGDMQWRRAHVTSDARPTDETPSTEQLGRFTYLNQSSFRGGAGQKFLNRARSDQTSFWKSENVIPFGDDNTLRLSPDRVTAATNSHGSQVMVATSDEAYVAVDIGGLTFRVRSYSLSGDTATLERTYSLTSETIPEDMTVGGGYVWVCGSTGIHRITPGTSTITQWTTEPTVRVLWIGDRLAAVRRDTTNDLWILTTYTGDNGDFGSTAVEEVTGGVFTLFGADNATLRESATLIGGLTAGSGFVFMTSWDADLGSGHVWAWPVNVLEPQGARLALATPTGSVPLDCFFYQGSVFVRYRSIVGEVDKIYQCLVGPDGTLSPSLAVSDAGRSTGVREGTSMTALGEYLFFGVPRVNDVGSNIQAIGMLDLTTGGWCLRQVDTQTNSGSVPQSLSMWQGRLCWTNAGSGLYVESATNRRSSGTLHTSIIDADSARPKRFTQLDMVGKATGSSTGSKIEVAYTTNGGTTYTDLNDADMDTATAGEKTSRSDVDVTARTLGLRFTLTRGSTATRTPEHIVTSMQFYLTGADEQVLQLPLVLADHNTHETGSRQHPQPGKALDDLAFLEALQGELVEVYDVDYWRTGVVNSYQLESIDARGMTAYNRAVARSFPSELTVMVTLRRELKDG